MNKGITNRSKPQRKKRAYFAKKAAKTCPFKLPVSKPLGATMIQQTKIGENK